jgi:hypothetical protein
MSVKIFLLFACLCLGTVSCNATQPPTPAPQSTPTPEIFMPLPPDQRAFEAVRASLAIQLGVDPLKIFLVDVTPMQWPDSCLGLPTPSEMCLQVITPGFLVRVRDGDAIYEFHTNRDASQIRQVH